MNIKQSILKLKKFPASLFNHVVMVMRGVQSGKELRTWGRIFIRGTGKIVIGDHVTITSCCETNPIGGDTKTILFAKQGGEIHIGDYSGLSNTAIVALRSVIIEDHVLIGGGCKIYDNDFHSLKYEERISSDDPGVVAKPVKVCQGAFVGAHTIILKGVTIGEKSIIGAGSVVTKSVPPGEIWAGNPARCISGGK